MERAAYAQVVPKDVNAAVATIKTKRTIQFVDWHAERLVWGLRMFKCVRLFHFVIQ